VIAGLLLASTLTAAATVRSLSVNTPVRDSLGPGEEIVFSIPVPAETAAKIIVQQQGIDVGVTLRIAGSNLPEHGLDMVAGPDGDEVRYVAISHAPATWNVFVWPAQQRAHRGDFTISLQLAPSDDRARAIAAERQTYQEASDTAWIGDGKSFEKAEQLYASAAEAGLAAGDRELAAESTYQCARIHDNLGDTPGAIERQLRALEIFRAIGQKDRIARVLNRLGDLSRKVGEIADAERYFEEALPLAREADDPIAVADILNNSAIVMTILGQIEESLERAQSAIPLAQELKSANIEGALWANIAEVYRRLGMQDKAIDANEHALKVVRGSNLPVRRTARALSFLGSAYFDGGDQSKAEASIREAIDLYDKAKDPTSMAETLGFLGRMQYANGETERALESFARAVPILRQAQNRGPLANVLMTWAEVDLERGEADSALQKLDEAVQLTRAIAGRHDESRALYLRARALQKTRKSDDAIESVTEAIGLVETAREAIARTELRTSYFATVRRYYDLQIELLQQRGRTADAFDASERARARTLLESLSESALKIRKGVDPDLLKRERVLKAELNAKDLYRAQIVLKEGERSARAVALGSRIDRLLEEWNDLQTKIRTSSPAYAALKMPEPIRARDVQSRLLDDSTALIAYSLGADRSFAWIIDRHHVTVHRLAAAAEIDKIARRYHELLSREIDTMSAADRSATDRAIAETGQKLASAVWNPIRSGVAGKRLLIVADGALQYVPFGALPSASGQPLIVQHEIVYLPSASVLEAIRRNPRRMAKRVDVAVFADPVFTPDDPRVSGIPNPARAETRSEARGGPYTRLRFSRQEADAIAKAGGSQTFQALDFTAAKKTISERDLKKFDIIHFATHGYLDTAHPDLSGLVLSLVDSNGEVVDGFLHLHEIYNLDLNASLVVLSACRTALGKEVYGEGLIGLTRGFMYAGASRVVSSVWNVDDRASALLMSRFYAAMLSKGMTPAAALRQAQISLLQQPRWASPHYWAAFGLQGEWK
jgi:CHAT domain-containing protein